MYSYSWFWQKSARKIERLVVLLIQSNGSPLHKHQDPLFYPLSLHNTLISTVDLTRRGGPSPEKEVRECAILKIPRPPFEAQVHSQGPHLKEKCDISPPKQTFFFIENMTIFSSKRAWKFLQNVSSKALFSMKIRSKAPTFMAIYALTSPQVQKSGPHIPIRKKSWVLRDLTDTAIMAINCE